MHAWQQYHGKSLSTVSESQTACGLLFSNQRLHTLPLEGHVLRFLPLISVVAITNDPFNFVLVHIAAPDPGPVFFAAKTVEVLLLHVRNIATTGRPTERSGCRSLAWWCKADAARRGGELIVGWRGCFRARAQRKRWDRACCTGRPTGWCRGNSRVVTRRAAVRSGQRGYGRGVRSGGSRR